MGVDQVWAGWDRFQGALDVLGDPYNSPPGIWDEELPEGSRRIEGEVELSNDGASWSCQIRLTWGVNVPDAPDQSVVWWRIGASAAEAFDNCLPFAWDYLHNRLSKLDKAAGDWISQLAERV